MLPVHVSSCWMVCVPSFSKTGILTEFTCSVLKKAQTTITPSKCRMLESRESVFTTVDESPVWTETSPRLDDVLGAASGEVRAG